MSETRSSVILDITLWVLNRDDDFIYPHGDIQRYIDLLRPLRLVSGQVPVLDDPFAAAVAKLEAAQARERIHLQIRQDTPQVRKELRKTWHHTFIQIGQRDGFLCRQCGGLKDLQIDHIVPVAKGGNNNTENLQLLCVTCNAKKSDRLTVIEGI